MIECRYCHEVFRKPPEQIGARCPTCRLPLFERDRHKGPPIDLGPCASHKDKSAHGKCERCGKLICAVCRTRWQDEVICPGCVDQALEKEPNPGLVKCLNREASWSLGLAITGWVLLLVALLPLRSLVQGATSPTQATLAGLLFLASFVPALCATGHGAACIRARGRRLAIATWGVSLAGAHLGLMLGLLLLNVWLN